MSDLISRQAAIDALARTAREKFNLSDEFDHYLAGLIDGEDAIRQLPSAQPEIIRCKDCKYMTEYYDTDGNVPYWTCSEWDSGTDCDGFCHYAERRTNE